MSQTVLFTPKSEEDDYFVVLTETGILSKIFKNVLSSNDTERFRSEFQNQSVDWFYGKTDTFGKLVLLE